MLNTSSLLSKEKSSKFPKRKTTVIKYQSITNMQKFFMLPIPRKQIPIFAHNQSPSVYSFHQFNKSTLYIPISHFRLNFPTIEHFFYTSSKQRLKKFSNHVEGVKQPIPNKNTTEFPRCCRTTKIYREIFPIGFPQSKQNYYLKIHQDMQLTISIHAN